MSYELIVRGGRVLDPSQDIDGVMDIAFSGGKVAALGSNLDAGPESMVRDAAGLIVTPGLIDLHTHVYWGGTSLGIDAEEFCRNSGVTTAVDTGSAGPGNFLGFRKHVIEKSEVRILAFLHISHAGIFAFAKRVMVGESEEIRLMNPMDAVDVALQNRDVVVGIKVRVGLHASGTQGSNVLGIALQVAEEAALPLMCHIDHPPPSYEEVVERLRPGGHPYACLSSVSEFPRHHARDCPARGARCSKERRPLRHRPRLWVVLVQDGESHDCKRLLS